MAKARFRVNRSALFPAICHHGLPQPFSLRRYLLSPSTFASAFYDCATA